MRKIVDQNGKLVYGNFEDAFDYINLLEAKRALGYKAPKFWKNFRLKEWEAFQLGNKDYFILGALYNTKVFGMIYISILIKKTNEIVVFERDFPAFLLKSNNSINDSVFEHTGKNYYIKFIDQINKNKISIELSIPYKEKGISVKLNGKIELPASTICHPFYKNRGVYSYKNMCFSEGIIEINGEKNEFYKNDSVLIIDDHKGYYPWDLKYDWVTGYKIDEKGQIIGFNLTHNQVENSEKNNENRLWVNGKINYLPPITVKYSGENWIIKDSKDRINLVFNKSNETTKKKNYGIMYVDYTAPMGSFEGFIVDDNGNKIICDNCFGMGERKRYRI